MSNRLPEGRREKENEIYEKMLPNSVLASNVTRNPMLAGHPIIHAQESNL